MHNNKKVLIPPPPEGRGFLKTNSMNELYKMGKSDKDFLGEFYSNDQDKIPEESSSDAEKAGFAAIYYGHVITKLGSDWKEILGQKKLEDKKALKEADGNSINAIGRAKPGLGDCYNSISPTGAIIVSVWSDSTFDNMKWILGNVFLTTNKIIKGEEFLAQEAAEKGLIRQMATVRVSDKLASLRDDPLDWADKYQEKYFLSYCVIKKELTVGITYSDITYPIEFYSSEKACRWVKDNMQEDVVLMLLGS